MDIISSLESILKTFNTDGGYWNPIVWVLAIVIIFLLAYVLRSFGRKDFVPKNEKTKVFLSGNPETADKSKMHVSGKNLYWGFIVSLKSVYNIFEKIHTGNTSDYVLWFVIILGILFILLGVL